MPAQPSPIPPHGELGAHTVADGLPAFALTIGSAGSETPAPRTLAPSPSGWESEPVLTALDVGPGLARARARSAWSDACDLALGPPPRSPRPSVMAGALGPAELVLSTDLRGLASPGCQP